MKKKVGIVLCAVSVLFLLIGFVYIGFAYTDLPYYSSLFYGICGGILTLAIMFLFVNVNVKVNIDVGTIKMSPHTRKLFQNLGYFFLAMAAYNLCPLFGVKCFALQPEKMIAYGLQTQAASFANHIMIELVLGFACICIYHASKRKEQKRVPTLNLS